MGMTSPLLVLVHPGSACGSADFNIGRSAARAARQHIAEDLEAWQGGIVVADGALSDELPRHPRLDRAIRHALLRARSAGLPGIRMRACDMEDADWPATLRRATRKAGVAVETPLRITGAWVSTRGSGCVDAARLVFAEGGFTDVVVLDSAVEEAGDH